eukprot:TRINITY_DN7076_c0_g2_i1.p1 TRINITY_DN7076_c0_g2~~TRINITY_DN7076_c0_g2_i1.p1  ORF type:complete len:390 (+),score=31.75 TRINITY_DN7076_c0_g2_i1:53-1222(+)
MLLVLVGAAVVGTAGSCGDAWGSFCGRGEGCCYDGDVISFCCEEGMGECCGTRCCKVGEVCVGDCLVGELKCVETALSGAITEACNAECCAGACCGKCCNGNHCTDKDSVCCPSGGASCPAAAPTCCERQDGSSQPSCCKEGSDCCEGCPAGQCCGGCECCSDTTTTCSHDLGACIPKKYKFLIPFLLWSWVVSIISTFLVLGWKTYVTKRSGYSAIPDGNTCLGCSHDHHAEQCAFLCVNEYDECPSCVCGRKACHRSDQKICASSYTVKQKRKLSTKKHKYDTVSCQTTSAICNCLGCACKICVPTLYCKCEACSCIRCRSIWDDMPLWLLCLLLDGVFLFFVSLAVAVLFDGPKYRILTWAAAIYTTTCTVYTIWLHVTGRLHAYR